MKLLRNTRDVISAIPRKDGRHGEYPPHLSFFYADPLVFRRWNFAKENKVILTDEYDQIARDLAPYFALEPHDLRHRSKVMQEREHTFTLSIKDGHVTRHGPHPELRRAKDMQNLMQKFAQHVPGEVNMTYIIDDQPAVMLSWNQKERMLELASQGECEYSSSEQCLYEAGS
jgi:hypothetical protein